MSDVMDRLQQARLAAWKAGLELSRLWDLVLTDLSAAEKIVRQTPETRRAIENLRDAMTLDGAAPRPSLAEAKVSLMRWGLDEGLIVESQYDEWVVSHPEFQEIEQSQ